MNHRPRPRAALLVASLSLLQPASQVLTAQSAVRSASVQSTEPQKISDHRFRFLTVGASIGAALAYGYYQLSEKGERGGRCQPLSCALPYLTISGAITGLFFAQELAAQRRAEMPRAGEALMFRTTDTRLPGAAAALTVRDTIVVAATDSGAQLLTSGLRPAALRRRGAGLSNLRSVAFANGTAGESRLLLGTGTALWETPLTTGVVSRIMEGPVDALGAAGNVVVAAFGTQLRVRRVLEGAARIDSIEVGHAVSAAVFDSASGSWWVSADSLLYQMRVPMNGERPVLIERATFGGTAKGLAVSPDWIAVALGGDGVVIWPRSALGGSGVISPIVLKGEPRFAFGLAFVGDQLFVAGGVDGVTQITMTPAPRIVGSSRQAGYATTITAENGVLWVGDSADNRLLRIVP